MSTTGFPEDDYTPHGYLANPHAVAHSWSEGEGGCLRTSREYLGLGWLLPWTLRAQASIDLMVTLESGSQRLTTRADFGDARLVSPHHTSCLFVYRWQAFGRRWEAAYTLSEPYALVDEARLGLQVSWEPAPDQSSNSPDVILTIALVGWRHDQAVIADPPILTVDLGAPYGTYVLRVDEDTNTAPATTDAGRVGVQVGVEMASHPSGSVAALAGRLTAENLPGVAEPMPQIEAEYKIGEPVTVSATVRDDLRRARAEDDAFWSNSARLEGDWPASWRRGWVYDLETTRMCVYPPGGIFTDVWPAWMVQWPRAVVAEGTLDMVRLAYVAPDLAKRAILSLFRDAEAPNVPCVFQHGEPNMVAADGSICGTSPAWCVPFYNLERLYALTGDRAWLERLYPYLGRYVEWWLAERTDPEGWAVYMCTWEAGEDDTPRLDPERRGDNVVSSFVRPVELQATMALSAGVLARFAESLGRPDDARRWQLVEADFAGRTQTLWDEAEGRFRDWDARAGTFLAPASQPNYWDIDPCRYSALAFTPVLAGIASSEQQGRLHEELRHYAGPPWTLWASWSYVVLEAAMLAGARELAGRVAHEIVGRVYAELDARDIASPKHPTPGVAREYWPLDLDTWEACEGYGWGANTASLLMRQIFGFLEQPPDASGALSFRLWPQLPTDLCRPGAVFRVRSLPYRGQSLTLAYQTAGDLSPTELTVTVEADVALACRVVGAGGEVIYASASPTRRHAFPGRNGEAFDVTLTAPT